MDIEDAGKHIVDSAIKVHSAVGPGLLESAYQRCIIHELRRRDLKVEAEITVPLRYEGMEIDTGYRLDIRVNEQIIVENKTVDLILPIHVAQLLTYLKLSGCTLGFILNWKVLRMRDGIRRLIWEHH